MYPAPLLTTEQLGQWWGTYIEGKKSVTLSCNTLIKNMKHLVKLFFFLESIIDKTSVKTNALMLLLKVYSYFSNHKIKY